VRDLVGDGTVAPAGDRVVVAMTRLAPVGVDVEEVRAVDVDALAGLVLGPAAPEDRR
jgi:phosphopantetheinyl transferase